MALVTQDDTGTVVGANSYIDVAYFKSYHDERGNVYGTPTDDLIAQKIIVATDYVDARFNYVGQCLAGRNQTTMWPRLSAFDQNRLAILGIPQEVKEATAEYALRALTGDLNPDPERDLSGATIQSKSEGVGPITESVTFVGGATFQMPRYPVADQKLKRAGLVRSGGTLLRA